MSKPSVLKLHETHKAGCRATIEMKETVAFHNVPVDTSSSMVAVSIMGRLRYAISKDAVDASINPEYRIYMRLPRRYAHRGHVLGEVSHQCVSESLKCMRSEFFPPFHVSVLS